MNIKQLLLIGIGSISFMASCSCSNNDQIFLDKLNNVLKEHANEISTCYDAIKTVEAAGIEINDYPVKDNQEFVYDSIAKQFVMMIGDEIIKTTGDYKKRENKYDYFKSVFVYDPNLEYSQYLDKRAEVPSTLLITTGFDIGDHIDIPNIAYTNLSNKAKDVIIRTYSDYFSVLAPNDTVHHYEIANNVIVTDVGTFDAHAECAYMKGYSGFINFSNKSSTDIFEVVSGSEDSVTAEVEGDAKVYSTVNISKTKSGKEFEGQIKCTTVHDRDEFEEAIKEIQLVRLNSDLNYSDRTIEFNESVVFDLNGYKLTINNNSNIYCGIKIKEGKSVYFMDSQGVLDENSGIVLNNCFIHVPNDNKDQSTNLVINSGKITFNTLLSPVSSAIVVEGNANKESSDSYPSNVIIYGGKIEAHSLARFIEANIFNPIGKGASVAVSYLNAYSDNSIVDLSRSPDQGFDNISFGIYGGNFISKEYIFKGTNDNTIFVDGGFFTCEQFMTAGSGDITIKNANISSGEERSDLSFTAIDVLDTTCKEALNINIFDTKIFSKYGYILNINEESTSTNDINVTFNTGVFDYFLGNGVNYKSSDKIHITISEGANFIKHQYA